MKKAECSCANGTSSMKKVGVVVLTTIINWVMDICNNAMAGVCAS